MMMHRARDSIPPSEMLQALRRHAKGDWDELAGEPAGENVQQREAPVDVHHVHFARGLPHGEERLEVTHRQRPA